MEPHSEDQRTRVFVSYSRHDSDFVAWLARELDRAGYLVDYDLAAEDPDSVTTGISAEDQWWIRLQDLITAADVVVFVVSPGSAASKVCDEEIAFAQAMGKRVVPILYRTIDFTVAPPRLGALNVKISFTEPGRRADGLAQLVRAINHDVEWLRLGARLLTTAREWDAKGRNGDLLLRGDELQRAETWAIRRPMTVPAPTDLVLTFIDRSREEENDRAAMSSIERARYLELIGVMRPFLETDAQILERAVLTAGAFNRDEVVHDLEYVRALLKMPNRWHPQQADRVGRGRGAIDGYVEYWKFPCCGVIVRDFRALTAVEFSQLRDDGCREIPEAIQHEYRAPAAPFVSELVLQFARLSQSTSAKGS